jgi:hypothetical protein
LRRRRHGWEARAVATGEEALRELAAHDYDLVGKVVARHDPKQKKHSAREKVPTHARGGEKIVTPPTWLAPR